MQTAKAINKVRNNMPAGIRTGNLPNESQKCWMNTKW